MNFVELEKEINETLTSCVDTVEQIEDENEKSEFMQHMEALLGTLAEQEAEKIDGYGHALSKLSAEEDRLDKIIKELSSQKKSVQTKYSNLKDYLLFNMTNANLSSVQGNIFKASVRENKSVEIINQDSLPEVFIKTTITQVPDKRAIMDVLKTGEEVPGAKINVSKSVVIKP